MTKAMCKCSGNTPPVRMIRRIKEKPGVVKTKPPIPENESDRLKSVVKRLRCKIKIRNRKICKIENRYEEQISLLCGLVIDLCIENQRLKNV